MAEASVPAPPTAAGPAAAATPPGPLLAGSLALVCLAALPLLGGGYSGSGYLVELVLMPLSAALAWLALRPRPALAQAVLLLYALSAVGLPFWAEEGRGAWAWDLALPVAWVLTWLLLTQVPERRRFLLPVLTGAAALTALAGLVNWVGSGHPDTRVISTFGWPNAYAGYLLVAWPLAGVGLLRARTALERTLYGGAGLLLVAAFVLTYSRAAWFVFALQLAGLAAVGLRQWLRTRRRDPASGAPALAAPAPARLPRWPLFGLPLLLGGLLLLPSVRQVLGRVADFGGYSMTGRIRFWQAALEMWRDHPLLGVGLGNFAAFYPHYQRYPYFYSNDPHSWPLQLLCELGLPGALLALLLLAGAVVWLRRIWRSLPPLEAGLLSAALVGSLAHAAVDFDYTLSATTALLGAVLAYGTWRAAPEPAPPAAQAASEPPPSCLQRALPWTTAGLLVLVALWGVSFTAERYTLDRLRDTPALPPALRQQLLEEVIRYNPLNAATHYQLASLLAQPGPGSDRDGALREAGIALQLNPRYAPAYTLRGLLAHPLSAGEADLKHALDLDPYNYPENWFAYASAASGDAERLARLKAGIEKLGVTDPITPHDVRSDWVKWNPMFAKWYYEMARLTHDPGEAAIYRQRAAHFDVAADEQRRAAGELPPADAAPAPSRPPASST
jgi:O-antigen ligase